MIWTRAFLAVALIFTPLAAYGQAAQPVVPVVGGLAVSSTNPLPVTGSGGAAVAANITGWAGGTLGAMANYGTSPGAVNVPGVNAFITNTLPVSRDATANSITHGLYSNLLQGDAALSTSNPLFVTGPGTAGTAAVNPITVQGVASMTPILVTPSNPIGITPTDRTVTSATGSSQTVMNANASRHSLIIQNTGSANCGVNPTGGTAVIGGAGTLTLVPNGSYQPRIPTLTAVTAICTAAQPLYAEEN